MMRQAGVPSSPDLRTIYNPLASNPVNQDGPAWDSSNEDVSGAGSPSRARGMTASSQASFVATPPLRSVTSIPDYAQYRGNERSNLSGTYKPNRGVPNWSHNDYYPPPPRPFRGEELRSSFRSGWTTTEASGTERSSIATARSSVVSERQPSIYSRDQSRDRRRDRDDSPETAPTSDTAEEDEQLNAVDDVLDSYYYDDEDENESQDFDNQNVRNRQSRSPATLDLEPPELSQTPSRDFDSLDSFQSSEILSKWDQHRASYVDNTSQDEAEVTRSASQRLSVDHTLGSDEPNALNMLDHDMQDAGTDDEKNLQVEYLPSMQEVSPVQPHYSPRDFESVTLQSNKTQSRALQRSSEELPRRVSASLQALALGAPSTFVRPNQISETSQHSRGPSVNNPQLREIRRQISNLPQLPSKKSRLSRQDWASIEAYSKRHSKRPSGGRMYSNESTSKELITSVQPPPMRLSQALPEVDEDEAIPRRASTSVYDRKSTLFNLGMAFPSSTSSKGTGAFGFSSSSRNQRPNEVLLHEKKIPCERDRYGFKKASDKISVQEYNAWAVKYEEHISRRRNKWIALMTKQGLSTTDPTRFPEVSEKVKRYARKGYPPEWRGAMWWFYSGGQHLIKQKEMVGLYASLVARINRDELNKDDKDAIERDLDRTFPDNIHFRPEPATDLLDGESDDEPSLIKDLREVLSCFALNNPHIGYCQSLNFIAGLLLLFLKQDKEKAFILLTIITRNHLPGAHARNLANTEVNVLMMLIKDYLPKVWASINDTDLINTGAGSNAHPSSKFARQPTVSLSCTSWFMSIFVGELPIETVLRVWDAFLYDGPRVLYRYALAIFKLGEPEIRKYQPGDGELFMTVQNLPRTSCLDPNVLHDYAFVKRGFGNLTQEVIDQKRRFWREQTKMAHQASVKSIHPMQLQVPSKDDDTDDTESGRRPFGLRRKASRKFRTIRGR